MTQVLLIHGGQSTLPKLEAALPGAKASVIYREGLSSGYNEVSGIAHDYPRLRDLLGAYVPDWKPGEPLVVLAFSAGGWALRYYLRDAEARADVTAAIFLDSLYSSGSSCDLTPYGGVIEYGKMANAEPFAHRLVMTYSQATPTPGICSQAIAKAVGGESGGVFVRPYANGDHGGQQSIAGPAAVAELVAPWIGATRGSSPWPWVIGATLLAAGVAYVAR